MIRNTSIDRFTRRYPALMSVDGGEGGGVSGGHAGTPNGPGTGQGQGSGGAGNGPGSFQSLNSNASTKKPSAFADIMKGLEDAQTAGIAEINAGLASAASTIAHAQAKAAAQIRAGMKEAAAATITAAKIGAKAIMDAAKLADDTVREFWAETNAILMPIIDQGGYAMDEMASMLGIPNADGEIVPFDTEELMNTPGFKFKEETGQRALINGTLSKLSGASIKAGVQFGQQLAQDTWQTRMQELGFLAQVGAQAGDTLAQQTTMTGIAAAENAQRAGEMVAQLESNKGGQLANIYMQGSVAQANNTMMGGSTMAQLAYGGAVEKAGLITGLATAGANVHLSLLAAQNQKKKSGGLLKSIGTIGGGILGGIYGGPAGASAGAGIGGSLFS